MRVCILLLATLSVYAQTAVRVAVGNSSPYVDTGGNTWVADTGCTTSTAFSTTASITGTPDPTLYQYGRRITAGAFACTYAVDNYNFYAVTVKFANTMGLQPGKVIFNIFVNNTKVAVSFDPAARSLQTNTAFDLGFIIPVSNSEVSINFVSVTGGAFVNAISIISMGSGGGGSPLTPGPTGTITIDNLVVPNLIDVTDNVFVTLSQYLTSAPLKFAPTSASGTEYVGGLSPIPLSGYSNGQVLPFVPDVDSTGPVSINIDGNGLKKLFQADGSTQVTISDLTTGVPRLIQYCATCDSGSGGWMFPGPVGPTGATGPQGPPGGLPTCVSASGSGTVYTCAESPTLASYDDNSLTNWVLDTAPTGTFTLNIDTLGAKPVYRADGVTLAVAGDLPVGVPTIIRYRSSLDGGSGGFIAPIAAASDPFAQNAWHVNEFDTTGSSAEWVVAGTGSPSNSFVISDGTEVGVWQIGTRTSGTTSGDTARASMVSGATGPFPPLRATGATWQLFDTRIRLKPDPGGSGAPANIGTWYCILTNGTNQPYVNTQWMCIIQDTTSQTCDSGDSWSTTDWMYIVNVSGSTACTDSGVAVVAGAWTKLRIYSATPGTIHMQIDGAADSSVTWTTTTGTLAQFGVATRTSTPKTVQVGKFAYLITGVAR